METLKGRRKVRAQGKRGTKKNDNVGNKNTASAVGAGRGEPEPAPGGGQGQKQATAIKTGDEATI